MFDLRLLKTCVKAVVRNPMRATLTVLGIVIGIAAVIAMTEIGKGSSNQIRSNMNSMGADTMMIQPESTAVGGVASGSGGKKTLIPEDARALAEECSLIDLAAPVVRARGQVVYGRNNWNPNQLIGTTPDYLTIRNWDQMADGVGFSEDDVVNNRRVCVIGSTVAKELFGKQDPLGKEIRISNVGFKVIGVLKSKGSNMMGWDQDDIVIGPLYAIKLRVSGSDSSSGSSSSSSSSSSSQRSASDLYPSSKVDYYPQQANSSANAVNPRRFQNIDQISVRLVNPELSQDAIKQVSAVLRERHRLAEGTPDDFSVRDMAEMSRMMSTTTAVMTNLLLVVATISLVVGGVGIMNIMLVSVTERTREIGLRMAVGAKPRDILAQFLIESILLCLVGGALGIALGRGVSYAVAQITGWPTEMSLPAMIVAVSVSAGIGIVFGWYPAWKASRLDPIESLRHE